MSPALTRNLVFYSAICFYYLYKMVLLPVVVVVVCAVVSVELLWRCNIGKLKHVIETALSWQKLENGFDICINQSDDCISQSDDYISQLPDEILADILSLLTIKEAVRTSILSRRWRHVTEYLPAINLDWFVMSGAPDRTDLSGHVCDACGRHKNALIGHQYDVCARYFESFRVNSNRFLRTCKNQKLLSFELSVCMTEYVTDISNWINFGLDMDVEKLSLKFFCGDYCVGKQLLMVLYPSQFSRLSKLKHLRLHSTILYFGPEQPMFSSLVTLHLSHVVFEMDNVECILFTSPTLEEVRLEVCVLPGKLHFGDNMQHLKTLAIVYCGGLTQVEICARNIKIVEFLGLRLVQYVFSKACKIENVVLQTEEGDLDKIFGGHLSADLPHLQNLSLMVLSFAVHQMPANPWTFYSVKTLDLFISWHDGRSDLVKFLPPLLKSLPNLQKLRVIMPWNLNWAGNEEKCDSWEHKHLKEVEIGSFVGAEIQLRLASYLLRCATALEQMVFDLCSWEYIGYGNWRHLCVQPTLDIDRCISWLYMVRETVSENTKILASYLNHVTC